MKARSASTRIDPVPTNEVADDALIECCHQDDSDAFNRLYLPGLTSDGTSSVRLSACVKADNADVTCRWIIDTHTASCSRVVRRTEWS